MKLSILIFLEYYLPGYKSGGPLQTIVNMVEALGNRYEFKIVTTDHDSFEHESYPGIKYGEWMQVGKAKVHYLKNSEINFKTYKKILKENQFSLIYFQSFFNPKFTILPCLALFCSRKRTLPVLLAPRGEFGPGAIAHKKLKKQLYLSFYKLFFSRLLKYRFHCSSTDEEKNTKSILGQQISCYCALDFNAREHIHETEIKVLSNDYLHLAFLSRLDPQKNLNYAISVLRDVKIPVQYDIYGNTYDQEFVQKCQRLIDLLPEHIKVNFKGTLPHPEVLKTLANYDMFFFPTKNENFGHVIHEALRAGLPVLISDQTPWHELEQRHAGWECPLSKPELFAARINEYAQMNMEEQLAMHRAALQYGIDVSLDKHVIDDNVAMFNSFFKGQ